MKRVYNKSYKYLIFNKYNSSVEKILTEYGTDSIYESQNILVFHVLNDELGQIFPSLKLDVSLLLMDDYYLLYSNNGVLDYQSFLNEFFTFISNDYERIIDTNRNIRNIRTLETLITRYLPYSYSLKILDFGCGTGLSKMAFSGNHEIVGVDSCAKMLLYAQLRGLNAYNENDLDSKYSSQYFDAIVSSYVFHLITDMSVLDLAWDKLKQNGLLVANFHKNRNIDNFKEYIINKCQKLIITNEEFSLENGSYIIAVK